MDHRQRKHVGPHRQDIAKLSAQKTLPLTSGHAAVGQKGADLIDHAGPLTHQASTYPVHGLEIELILGLGGDKLHGRSLDRLGDDFGIAEVILLSLR